MLQNWFDPMALGIVFVGTIAATLLRCGWADMRVALAGLIGLFEARFDPAQAKSELSKQICEIANDGFIRAEPRHFGDSEFDSLADLMISERSIQSLHGEHRKYKLKRTEAAQKAHRVLDCAAELAPVLGLAGTLIALGSARGGTPGAGGLVEAIAMAVITTLYGLLAANFLFAPLAAAVLRRSRAEERDRDAVLDWLDNGIRRAGTGQRLEPETDAETGPRPLRTTQELVA